MLFQVGMNYDSEDIILKEIRDFATKHCFQASKRERCKMRCGMAANSHFKKKAAGEIVLQKKRRPWLLIVHGLLIGLQVKSLR